MKYKDEPERLGNTNKASVALKVEKGRKILRIFISKLGLISQRRSYDMIEMIAAHCNIRDNESLRLLYAALSDPDIDRVWETFALAGHEFVEGGPLSMRTWIQVKTNSND
jgi:hypothetical protein